MASISIFVIVTSFDVVISAVVSAVTAFVVVVFGDGVSVGSGGNVVCISIVTGSCCYYCSFTKYHCHYILKFCGVYDCQKQS